MGLRCWAFGCRQDGPYNYCDRCGAEMPHEFYDRGRLSWVIDLYRKIRNWTWPRCETCNKRIWRRYQADEDHYVKFCSEECCNHYVPF